MIQAGLGLGVVTPAAAQTAQYRSARGVEYHAAGDTAAVTKAAQALAADPGNVERIIALGTAQAGARQMREAVATFSEGLRRHPNHPLLLRWRGHRHLTLRDFSRAEADLLRASRLDPTIYGIWYHLGVLRFLKGDFAGAATAFATAQPRAPDAGELAGSTDWLWMSLMRAGRRGEAQAMLARRPDSLPTTNQYARRLALYRGEIGPDAVITAADTSDVSLATLSYGLGNWYLVRGDSGQAWRWFERAISSGGWPAFGFIVAEAELARMPRGVTCATAIIGATLIDGNGGPPVVDATVLVRGKKIEAVGPRASVTVPACATRIDGAGKFLTPGFIDTNVHISLGGNMESNVRYQDQRFDITLEGAQLHLKRGITTIRDSYGILKPLVAVRDAISRGDVIGPRMYVAGNIVGWGGFFATTFGPPKPINLWQEQLNDDITEGSGEDLILMGPDSLRLAMNRYLDKKVDFVKFGGTVHTSFPTTLVFSPRQVKVIVDETHKRGLVAETHSTSPEGLLIAVEAGIDLIQHPEVLETPYTDELVRAIVSRGVICSMNINSHTGKSWRDYLATRRRAEAEAKERGQDTSRGSRTWPARKPTYHEWFESTIRPNVARVHRANAERLIREGCIVSVATDNDLGGSPEFEKAPGAWRAREPGIGTLISIEGLVELGMTPLQALTAATKNGALASKALRDYGTVEVGKFADLLLLDASPLEDIRNVRRLGLVMKEGAVIDHAALPTKPIFTRSRP